MRAAEPLLAEPLRGEIRRGSCDDLRDQLGAPGAAARVAEMALEMIG